ncbi:MAG TPA: hypothetical protein VF618_10460 [Thermoanaerobaculia bacterium]
MMVFEFIAEFIAELLLELFAEGLLDLGSHALDDSVHARRILRVVLSAAAGAAVGGLSLLVFPDHFIRSAALRLASLIVTPLLAGGVFAAIGRRRVRKGKRASALEAFLPAFVCALALALVRYYGAS